MKGFNIAPPQQSSTLPPVAEFMSTLPHQHSEPNSHHYEMFGSTLSNLFGPGITPKKALHGQLQQFSSSQSSFGDTQPMSMFGKLAPRMHNNNKRIPPHKRKWGTLIEAAKSGSVSRFIGRSRSEDSVCNAPQIGGTGGNSRLESVSHSNSPVSEEAITESPTDSNPSLDRPDIEMGHQDIIVSKSKGSNHHFNFGALAALKRRRKKFSNSRHASPILEPNLKPITIIETERKLSNASRNLLQRASSVPARSSLTTTDSLVNVLSCHVHETAGDPGGVQSQSQQDSVDTQILDHQSTLTASTTEESVNGHHFVYQEPILSGPIELLKPSTSTTAVKTPQITASQVIPNLPNVIPVRGHLHQQGWL